MNKHIAALSVAFLAMILFLSSCIVVPPRGPGSYHPRPHMHRPHYHGYYR